MGYYCCLKAYLSLLFELLIVDDLTIHRNGLSQIELNLVLYQASSFLC